MIPVFLTSSQHSGANLLLRCLDDHPDIVGFNDSYVSTLCYKPWAANYNRRNMKIHGFNLKETVEMKKLIEQGDFGSILKWGECVFARLKERMGKPDAKYLILRESDWIGPPDVFGSYRISTIRDPRAVWASGLSRKGIPEEGQTAINRLGRNWNRVTNKECKRNIFVRYEDFAENPQVEMDKIYKFIRAEPDYSFLDRKPKPFDERFNPGVTDQIHNKRVAFWRTILPQGLASSIRYQSPHREIADRFEYMD